ncbi:unnamed protein product [Cuscuta campestris]|uniref:CCHC-type domain-containing protein n=1 Tax=Cuscuta campestris TaxID=132261 RepID=A0A484MN56_9ASTE|nr:unnamed protein product [Cuscuta campestris]
MAGMDGFGFDAHTGNGSSSETPVVNVSAGLGGSVGQTTPINVPFGSSAAMGSTPITTFVGSSATMGSAPFTSVIGPTAATAAMVPPLGPNMASAIPVIPSLGPNTGVFTSAPVGHPTVMLPANSVKEPEKFTGVGFKIWQQRMLFWLTTLNLARYLREDPPVVGENADEPTIQAKEAWIANNYTCLNLILNCLSDALYAVYRRAASAKELWTTLSNKYQAEDAGAKKFVVAYAERVVVFATRRSVGSRVNRVHGRRVLHEFRSYLKLKRKEMTLKQLLVRLRIREEGLTREKKVVVAKANVVEHPPKEGSSKGPKPNKDKKKIGPKGGVAKTKFAGKCYNCGITGHRSSECRKKPQKKKQKKEEALCSELDAMDLCAVVTEVNLVGSNPKECRLYELVKKNKLLQMISFVDPGMVGTLACGNIGQRSRKLADRFKGACDGQHFLIPFNDVNHWALTVAKPNEEVVYYMDPLKRLNAIVLHKNTMNTPMLKKKVSWENMAGITMQKGNVDCGLFVMRYMKEICQDKEVQFASKGYLLYCMLSYHY